MVDGVQATLAQARTAGTALTRLRRTVEAAAAQNEEVENAVEPLQFRMEGTGRRALRTVNSINSKLQDVLLLIDGCVEDLVELEEALTS